MKLFLRDEGETLRFGRELAKFLEGREVLCLFGELGSGKTTFVRGLVEGLGLKEGYSVRSPTFTLVNEYPTKRGKVIHIDLYRAEVEVEEFLGEGIVLIEWAKDFPFCDLKLRFGFLKGGRIVEVSCKSPRLRRSLQRLKSTFPL